MESQNLQRGIQLFELGRYKDAISYFEKSIKEDPTTFEGKYYFTLCHVQEDNTEKAEELAKALLQEQPNDPDTFYLNARIAYQNDKKTEAMSFVNQAIQIQPYDANYFGLKGGILLGEKKYEKALEAVNEGLNIDPKNGYCLNLRAQILTKLNRISEADETVEDILYDNPEDAFSHANVGWVQLENGNNKKALNHFKEALKIDPNFEYAREGMSTALKSKNIIYSWYLKYSFWISKKSSKNQWAFIIGLYVVYRLAFKLLSASGMSYLAIPLMIAYLLFALGSWFMEPLSNSILNFDSYGKYLLSHNEKISGYLFGGLVILGLTFMIIFYATGIEYTLVLAVAFICALLPLPRSVHNANRKGRIASMAYGSLMILIGIFGPLFTSPFTAGAAVFIMMIAYTWVGSFIEDL